METLAGHGLEPWAEAVLEVPFDPTMYQPAVLKPPHRLVPVQVYVQDYLHQEFPDVCQPGATPDDGSVAEIRRTLGTPRVDLLRRYVSMAHDMAGAARDLQRETYESPGLQARAEYQYSTTKSILNDLQLIRVPGNALSLPPAEEALQTGVVVVAPCGFGKTWVGAHAMASSGVGRRDLGDGRGKMRGLVVAPSIDRLYEYAEEDESNIFRRIVGMDVPVGMYYGYDKNPQAITIITEASLRSVVENDTDVLKDVGMILFDEIHHGTSRKNMEALQKLSGAVVGLTATPAYSRMRDIRHHFPHAEVGSLREFTEMGILNNARLLTYRAVEGEGGMEQSAVSLAVQWLRQGRRVVVYAPRSDGQEEHYTDRIAAEINRQMGDEVVGAARSVMGYVAQQAVQAFRKKRLQGLVTVNMVSVGSNIEADTLIMCGPLYSEVSLTQKVGRAMRPTDKETILAEIWPHKPPTRPMVTLAMLFGIENFKQGMIVGRETAENKINLRKTPNMQVVHEKTAPPAPPELPPMTPEEIRSYIVGPDAEQLRPTPPEGWLDGIGAMLRYNSTEEHIIEVLDAAGIRYIRYSPKYGARRVNWFDPRALAYLEEHRPLEVCGDTFKPVTEICEMLDIPEWLVQELCDANEIPQENRIVEKLRRQKSLSDQSIIRLMEALHQLPDADSEKDVNVGEITEATNKRFISSYLRNFGVQPRLMRFGQETDVRGYGYFLTSNEAEDLLALYAVRNERDGLKSLADIAKDTGLTQATLISRLTAAERATIRHRSTPGGGKLARFVPDTLVDVIEDRETLAELDESWIARPALTALFANRRAQIVTALSKDVQPDETFTGRFMGNRSVTTYVKWDAVRRAAGKLVIQDEFQNLDSDRLQKDRLESEYDEDQVTADRLYARLSQSTLMPWYVQDTWHTVEGASFAMDCMKSVVEVFCSRESVRRKDLLRLSTWNGELKQVHFNALKPIFKAVVAAPKLDVGTTWRTHDSIIHRATSKEYVEPEHVKFPLFTEQPNPEMIVARRGYRARRATLFYSAHLAERIHRRALANAREAQGIRTRKLMGNA